MRDLIKATVFLDPKLHEDLKIRIHYDGFKSQSEFIRACVISYLSHDAKFMEFLDDYRANEKLQSKAQIRRSTALRRTGKELVKKMGLSEEEIENIFDLIEEELPEL
jgi:Arc/MetJ-type ribon-helix-helix transcriptional regulator